MQINKTELQHALEMVKPGLANKELIEQSTSFAFMNGRVVTYNDEISINHPVKGLEIEGAIQAQELYQLLNKLKKEEIEVVIENNEIRLTSGRAKAGISLQSEIKLPLKEIGKISKWKPLPDTFIEALKFSISACSRDMSRPVLTCVHISKQDFIEASDSYRIARFNLITDFLSKSILIPAFSVVELIKMKLTKVAEGEGWIHFKTEEGTEISCRIIEEAFPDTTKHLSIEGSIIKFPKSIKDILDKAMIFSKRDHALDETITITLSGRKLIVKSQSESGWFEEVEKLEEAVEGELIFNITPYLLKDILSQTHICVLSGSAMKFTGANWEYVTSLKS